MEAAVVLLDVGPAMAPHLGAASRALTHFLLSKMANTPAHEVALVFFGTTGTRNALHQEFWEKEGDDEQYCNITTAVPLSVTSVEKHLKAVADLALGQGPSDFLNALLVACGVLSEAIQAHAVHKRVLVFSCFQGPTQEDEDGEFAAELIRQLQGMHVQLDVVQLAGEGGGEPQAEPNTEATLEAVLQSVRHTRRVVRGPLELLAAHRFKENASRASFAGDLDLSYLTIRVKVCHKTRQERLPAMKRVVAATGDPIVVGRQAVLKDAGQAVRTGDGGQVLRVGGGQARPLGDSGQAVRADVCDQAVRADVCDQAVPLGDDEDDLAKPAIVGEAQVGKAYRYGTDMVPIEPGYAEQMIKLHVHRSFKVVGVVVAASAPASCFLSNTWLVVPDKAVPEAHAAIAALAGNLRAQGLALVARYVPRTNEAITMGLLTPMPAEQGRPAALLMRTLPFEEDMRVAGFPSFDAHEDLKPDVEQTAATDALIDALILADGKHEQLAPERTGNPSLHRFLDCVGKRVLALDEGAPPDDGSLADRTLRARLESPEAQRAAARMLELFDLAPEAAGEAEDRHAPRQLATAVGTASPKEDFEDILGRDTDAAFSGMAAAIHSLVTAAEPPTSHKVAVECLQRLRGAAAKVTGLPSRAQQFNQLLADLAQAYKAHPGHGGFWAAAMAEGVRPLTVEDADGGVPPAEAEAFWRRHCETQPMET